MLFPVVTVRNGNRRRGSDPFRQLREEMDVLFHQAFAPDPHLGTGTAQQPKPIPSQPRRGKHANPSGPEDAASGSASCDANRCGADATASAQSQTQASVMALPVSLWRDQERIYIAADVPGMTESEIDITYHEGVLTIQGERRAAEGAPWVHNSRRFGRFEQAIRLGDDVNPESIAAHLDQGVLRLVLARKVEAQPKKITVQTQPRV